MLLTYRTVGSMLILQHLYINYIPEQAPAVPRLNTKGVVGAGWGTGVAGGKQLWECPASRTAFILGVMAQWDKGT